MGAVKNILAKDFLGNWMTIYSTIVDGTTQALYDKFTQYRYFRPSICGTPFLTRHLRWGNCGYEHNFAIFWASYSGCLVTPCPTLPPPLPTFTDLFLHFAHLSPYLLIFRHSCPILIYSMMLVYFDMSLFYSTWLCTFFLTLLSILLPTSNILRFEMDTRTVQDWNEWDFFRLGELVNLCVCYRLC